MTQGTQTGALTTKRSQKRGSRVDESFKREGAYIDLWLVHNPYMMTQVTKKPEHFNVKLIITALGF